MNGGRQKHLKPFSSKWKTHPTRTILGAITILSVALIIFGCSSSGDSSTSSGSTGSRDVSALELPDRVSLTADDEITGSANLGRAMLEYGDAGTDYTDQEKRTWVDDNTDALSMVNEILEVMDQTNYADYVNYGPYKALVKEIKESDQSQGGQSSSNNTTESYMEMTLDVTRANESSPMYVNIWLEEEEGPGDMPMLIRGRFIVTREAGEGYPYGEMEAHFKGNVKEQGGTLGDELFNMAISIGRDDDSGGVSIEYVEDAEEEGGNFVMRSRANIIADATLTNGTAYTYNYEYMNFGDQPEEFESTHYVAFNEDYFKLEEEGGETLVFDKNNLAKRIFRYKLFDKDTGALVTRSSGFPFRLPTGEHGYIGYWGMWTPYGVDVEDGDTIIREGTEDEYTVVKKAGRLMRHTEATETLADLINVEMSFWDENTDSIISWNGTNFKKIGTRNNENGQIAYADGGVVTFSDEWQGAWCEALRAWLPLGQLFVDNTGQFDGSYPPQNTTIKYHTEQIVNPGSLNNDLTLYYGDFALDAPITQDVIDNSMTAQNTYWNNPAMKTYTFDISELVLLDADGDAVIIDEDLDLSESWFSWGYHMHPLITTQLSIENWWQAWDEDTFYSWQTGQDEWQQFSTVMDEEGSYAEFDPPIMLSYTHSNANDANYDGTNDVEHNGKKFNFDYDGFELHIPWEFNEDSGDWEPMLNLADGTTLTSNGTEYVVKGVEQALIMEDVSDNPPAASDGLEVDTTIAAPTLEYDYSVTDEIGDLPENAEVPAGSGESAYSPLLVVTGYAID